MATDWPTVRYAELPYENIHIQRNIVRKVIDIVKAFAFQNEVSKQHFTSVRWLNHPGT